MLSGSAILRVGVLLVVAALLAALVQMLLPHDTGPAEPPISKPVPGAGAQAALPPVVTRPTVPASPPARPEAAPAPPPAVAAPPQAEAAPVRVPAAPPPMPPSAPPLDFGRPATQATQTDAAGEAAESAGPRGVAVVDLNSGSLADLNSLKGGGMIGRAIVQKRPYTSIGELLSKRVLSRAVYERIKDQVTVR